MLILWWGPHHSSESLRAYLLAFCHTTSRLQHNIPTMLAFPKYRKFSEPLVPLLFPLTGMFFPSSLFENLLLPPRWNPSITVSWYFLWTFQGRLDLTYLMGGYWPRQGENLFSSFQKDSYYFCIQSTDIHTVPTQAYNLSVVWNFHFGNALEENIWKGSLSGH